MLYEEYSKEPLLRDVCDMRQQIIALQALAKKHDVDERCITIGNGSNDILELLARAFVLPQNNATILVDEVLVEEDLKETFYWMVGLSYKFGQK